ncbi:metalloendopeptidase [Aureococcus anophagefferens]|nr:metalloendopeptidase [Aureococcus anophagefferens]
MYRDVGGAVERVAKAANCSVVRVLRPRHRRSCSTRGEHPHYTKNKATGIMKPGHIFTIEPMINLGVWRDRTWPDQWTVTADGKKSAQFEHTFLVTDDGYEILTMRDDEPKMVWDIAKQQGGFTVAPAPAHDPMVVLCSGYCGPAGLGRLGACCAAFGGRLPFSVAGERPWLSLAEAACRRLAATYLRPSLRPQVKALTLAARCGRAFGVKKLTDAVAARTGRLERWRATLKVGDRLDVMDNDSKRAAPGDRGRWCEAELVGHAPPPTDRSRTRALWKGVVVSRSGDHVNLRLQVIDASLVQSVDQPWTVHVDSERIAMKYEHISPDLWQNVR